MVQAALNLIRPGWRMSAALEHEAGLRENPSIGASQVADHVLARLCPSASCLSFDCLARTVSLHIQPHTMDEQTMSGDTPDFDLSNFDIAEFLKTPHNARLYREVQKLKTHINELVDYQAAHPLSEQASADSEKQVKTEIEKKEKYIRAQLSVIKTLYRQSVLRVREEKANTADVKAVNDALILGLHNLKYEEQSLRSEIFAAENYEYVE